MKVRDNEGLGAGKADGFGFENDFRRDFGESQVTSIFEHFVGVQGTLRLLFR